MQQALKAQYADVVFAIAQMKDEQGFLNQELSSLTCQLANLTQEQESISVKREEISQQVRSLKENKAQLIKQDEDRDAECSKKDGQVRWVAQEIASVRDELSRGHSHEQALQGQLQDQTNANKENLF